VGHTRFHLVKALRHKRNIAVSSPDGVTGVFHWRIPSDLPVTLGSSQPVTEMSTMNISWAVKAAGA